jgi:hypothetical protein
MWPNACGYCKLDATCAAPPSGMPTAPHTHTLARSVTPTCATSVKLRARSVSGSIPLVCVSLSMLEPTPSPDPACLFCRQEGRGPPDGCCPPACKTVSWGAAAAGATAYAGAGTASRCLAKQGTAAGLTTARLNLSAMSAGTLTVTSPPRAARQGHTWEGKLLCIWQWRRQRQQARLHSKAGPPTISWQCFAATHRGSGWRAGHTRRLEPGGAQASRAAAVATSQEWIWHPDAARRVRLRRNCLCRPAAPQALCSCQPCHSPHNLSPQGCVQGGTSP